MPDSLSITSALSQEAYFTSFVEGADYPIQAAVEFLRRGSEPENAYEQNIMNNYQAGSYLLSALSIPFDEGFVKELAATLTDGQDGYRTTDTPSIPAMEGESFRVPPANMLADRMGQFYAFLADVGVHPLIKAAVGQAYILAARPFQDANERLGRLISNAVLLRYGYDFFLDISISAYIARESYRYFKAMREIIKGGATTILVSHSLAQIRSLCNKILWLHKGEQIAFTDDVQGVCDSYEEFLRAPAGTRPRFDSEEIAAKRAVAKAEAERQAEERRRQEEERRRKAAEAAAELARLRAESKKLAEVRRILKGGGK